MAWLRIGLLVCALAFTQEARAPSTAEAPTSTARASGRAHNIARPIFFGLVAMAFLIASGLAAQRHRKARSRRGGGSG
jgi:hypothetical protein